MNVNPMVLQALATLNIQADPDECGISPPPAEYIVFNYSDERPDMRADDTDISDLTEIQVHYFARKGIPRNLQDMKKSLRARLRSAGFTILNTQQFYESDTKMHHIVVECNIDSEINDEEVY